MAQTPCQEDGFSQQVMIKIRNKKFNKFHKTKSNNENPITNKNSKTRERLLDLTSDESKPLLMYIVQIEDLRELENL